MIRYELRTTGLAAGAWRRGEITALVENINARLAVYRSDLGENAYAVFNTVTDVAARPPGSKVFNKDRATLEVRAGKWLRTIASSNAALNFDWQEHLASIDENVIRPQRPQRN